MRNLNKNLIVAATLGALALSSHAAVDSTEVISAITAAIVTISAIGLAVLSLTVTVKVFKWVARVL